MNASKISSAQKIKQNIQKFPLPPMDTSNKSAFKSAGRLMSGYSTSSNEQSQRGEVIYDDTKSSKFPSLRSPESQSKKAFILSLHGKKDARLGSLPGSKKLRYGSGMRNSSNNPFS